MGFFSFFKKSLGIGVLNKPKNAIKILTGGVPLPGKKTALNFATGGASGFMDAFKKAKGAKAAAAPSGPTQEQIARHLALQKGMKQTNMAKYKAYKAKKLEYRRAAATRAETRGQNLAVNRMAAGIQGQGEFGASMARRIAERKLRG